MLRIGWTSVCALATLVGASAPTSGAPATAGKLSVEDVFGRVLDDHGLVLVDWEGYLANPAIRFFVRPPQGAKYPGRLILSAKETRLYFDLPSEAGPQGPRKEVVVDAPGKIPAFLAIFPDRDPRDEDHALDVEFVDAAGTRTTRRLPVHVVDQDQFPARKPLF